MKTLLALLLSAASIVPAFADDRTETVKFAPGSSSVTLKSSLKGYDGINYKVGVRAGQVMTIGFKPSHGSCYYVVREPGKDENLFDGTMDGYDYSGTLTADGDYTIMVFQMRNAARRNQTCKFSLSVAIGG